jgi:multiple sugar transport system permease protein
MSTTVASGPVAPARELPAQRQPRLTPQRVALHAFLILMALGWLFPVAWAVVNSFRNYQYTSQHGYASLGGWTIDNYVHAWQQADFTQHFLNSV